MFTILLYITMASNKLSLNDDDDLQEELVPLNVNEPFYGSIADFFGKFFGCCCCFLSCGCCCNPYKTVNRGNRGVITRFGAIKEITSDGLQYVNPISEDLVIVNMMLHSRNLCNQSILTKDNLPIQIDGNINYRVIDKIPDIVQARFNIVNVETAVDVLAHSTLRLVFGKHTLQECLEKRQEFAKEMTAIIGNQAKGWGISIENIQIIDIVIPKHIQDLLATGATAQREAAAQIIMANASVEAAQSMREAANLLNTPAAMQMRLLETYKILAESQNAKIIFMPNQSMDNLTANIIGNKV